MAKNLSQQGDLKNQVDWLRNIMFALIVVLFLGFAGMFVAVATMLVDSWNNKQATYQDLRDQVKGQNDKLDSLTQVLSKTQKSN